MNKPTETITTHRLSRDWQFPIGAGFCRMLIFTESRFGEETLPPTTEELQAVGEFVDLIIRQFQRSADGRMRHLEETK